MNCQRFILDELQVGRDSCSDALRAVLHTIVLTRAVGPVTPRAGKCSSYSTLGYARAGIPEAELAVDEVVERFASTRGNKRNIGPGLTKGEIVVSFYEKRERSSLFGMVGGGEERLYWEHWFLSVVVDENPPADMLREERAVRKSMMQVVTLVNENGEHLPPPPNKAAYSFEMRLGSDPDAGGKNPVGESQWTIANLLLQHGR